MKTKSWSNIGGQRIRLMRRLERQISAQKGVYTRAKNNEQVAKAIARIQQLQRRMDNVNRIANKYMENIYKGYRDKDGKSRFDIAPASKQYARSRYMYGRVSG